jgi:hypothetical protein
MYVTCHCHNNGNNKGATSMTPKKNNVGFQAQYVSQLKWNISMQRDPDWSGDTIYVLGMKNGAPRDLIVTAHYKVPVYKCTDLNWAVSSAAPTSVAAAQ